ncbi:hypothetical protein MycrhDRAFT_3357 [Mycolicibacterium rhodesiae JS60]|nr:hypothetical protein MycrhDRAFT_3357 [Mycolicibacterium rhodesiae JS60]
MSSELFAAKGVARLPSINFGASWRMPQHHDDPPPERHVTPAIHAVHRVSADPAATETPTPAIDSPTVGRVTVTPNHPVTQKNQVSIGDNQ